MNKTILIGFIVFVLISQFVFAGDYLYTEYNAVGRIVGESPNEYMKQLKEDEIKIESVDVFSSELESNYYTPIIYYQHNFLPNIKVSFSYSNLNNFIDKMSKDNLFILLMSEAKFEDGTFSLRIPGGVFKNYLEIEDVKEWQESFEQNNPLLFFDAPYAGAYLPLKDSYVSRLTADSTIIAPTSFNSPEFIRSLVCNMEDTKTIGEIYTEARNLYYTGSMFSMNNMKNLVLQSYALYGDPTQKIIMSEYNRSLIKDYCYNFLENLDIGVEFLREEDNNSIFRKTLVFDIENYTINNQTGFDIIEIDGLGNIKHDFELVEPVSVRRTQFPLKTIFLDFRIENLSNPEDLYLNLPSYYDSNYTQRYCYENKRNSTIFFSQSFEKNNNYFVADVYPVEIVNCSEGHFRLYKHFEYSVDYYTPSPINFVNIKYNPNTKPNSIININIETMKITQDEEFGSIAIYDNKNNIVAEKEFYSNEKDHLLEIKTPKDEGFFTYSVEYRQDDETLLYDEISFQNKYFTYSLDVPLTFRNIKQLPLTINYENISWFNISYEVFDENLSIYQDFIFYNNSINNQEVILRNKCIDNSGIWSDNFICSGIDENKCNMMDGMFYLDCPTCPEDKICTMVCYNRCDLSLFERNQHNFKLELNELEIKNKPYELVLKITSPHNEIKDYFQLYTNNFPFVEFKYPDYIYETEEYEIKYDFYDKDNDLVNISINDSRFSKYNNSFLFKSNFSSQGNYSLNLTINDSYYSYNRMIKLEIKKRLKPMYLNLSFFHNNTLFNETFELEIFKNNEIYDSILINDSKLNINLCSDDPRTSWQDGFSLDDNISFKVYGYKINKIFTWKNNKSIIENITLNKNHMPVINMNEIYSFSSEEDIKLFLNISDIDKDELNVNIEGIGNLSHELNKFYYILNKNDSIEGNYEIDILVDDGGYLISKTIEISLYKPECNLNEDCPKANNSELFCNESNVFKKEFYYECKNPGLINSQCVLNYGVNLNENCEDECLEGKCVKIECHNNDDCDDYSKEEKRCYKDNIYVIEYEGFCKNEATPDSFCDSKKINLDLIETCKYGCSDSKCIEEKCVDSDKGINVNIKGSVNYLDLIKEDFCVDSNYLTEYYCSKNELKEVIRKCSSGCLDGKCLEEELIYDYLPKDVNLKFDKPTNVEFSVNNNDDSLKYYWYVNGDLVSTYSRLNYEFILGDYEVRLRLINNDVINEHFWNVNIEDNETLEKYPDLYIKDFRLLSNPRGNDSEIIEVLLGNKGTSSARNFSWAIKKSNIDIIENGSFDLILPGDTKILMLKINTSNYHICDDKLCENNYFASEDNLTGNYYYFEFVIDYNNSIIEANETNNNKFLRD